MTNQICPPKMCVLIHSLLYGAKMNHIHRVGGMPSIEHLKPYFHVIAVISNPVRFRSRYALMERFIEQMKKAGVNLWIVEAQQGLRSHVTTHADNIHHIQIATEDELWIKENMVNLGIQRLPSDWKYVAWVDADIEFLREDWVEETIQQLQSYHVVQMFQTCIDLGPSGEAIQTHTGFAYSYLSGKTFGPHYSFWHPGYAWAATREAITGVGGLVDRALLGAGDHHMALAFIGRAEKSFPGNINKNYRSMIMDWQGRAERYIKRDLGFVHGNITHHWHGKKKDRKYVDRWSILTKNNYDPYLDVYTDWQGLYRLEDDKIQLRDDIRAYFRGRNEDSIDHD